MNHSTNNELQPIHNRLSTVLFEQSPLPCLVLDTISQQIILANKAALDLYGYSADELYALSVTELFHPVSKLQWLQSFYALPARKEWKLSVQQQKKTKETIVADVYLSLLQGEEQGYCQVLVVDLTEAQSKEQEVRTERERYKLYIEQSSEGIFCQQFIVPVPVQQSVEQVLEQIRDNSIISECNSAMAKMYGYDQASELIGIKPTQLLDRNDKANVDYIRAFIENGFKLFDAESHERDRYGDHKYFLNNLIGIIENGCLTYIWGTQRDITEKKRGEGKIRLLANLVEQTSDVLTATDLDFRPISWNKAAEKVFGISAKDAVGANLRDIINIGYQHTTYEEVRSMIHMHGEWRGELYFIRPTDERRVTLLTTYNLLKDDRGVPLGYIIGGTDITERKEAELKLEESENRFRYIADTAPVMIWICNEKNKTTYASKPWINFTGLDIVNDPHTGWSDVVHPEDVDAATKTFDECFALQVPSILTYRIRTKDGSYRWVQDASIPRVLEDGSFLGYIGCVVDIHDTKSKEEQLRQQAIMLDQVLDIIITTDLDIHVKTLNKVAERCFGVTEEKAKGKKLRNYVRLQVCNTTEQEAYAELERNGVWKGEVSFTDAAGEERYILQTVTYTYDDRGQRNGIMSVGRDITDRKQADEKLKQSESFYRSLIADSLDGMLLVDYKGTITFVSPSIRHILGYEAEEVVGLNAFEFVHPDDRSWAWSSFQRELEDNPEVKFIVVRLQMKCGDWLWCSVRGHNLLENPYVNSLVIYFHDDSLRKKATDALKESEKRFRSLIRDLQIGISLYNASGELTMCNSTYSGLLNCNEDEILGAKLLELFPEAYKEDGSLYRPEERPLYVALHTGQHVRDAVMGLDLHSSGERTWLLINIELMLDERGNVLQAINSVIDITERKKLEQKLIDEQINKQRLLTQASIDGQEKERKEIGKELHDNIGQQLTTTKLFLDMAKSTADDTTAEMISMALKGVSDVINEVRHMSRSLMPPTLGDLGLIECISDLVESISRTQFLRIDLDDYEFSEDTVPDNQKLMLFRIIQEQLNNIVKHAEAKKVSIQLRNDKPFMLLEIKDDGKGFDLKAVRKGLGLTNMRNRAELFGGEVKITSSLGKGCTLTVKVPHSLKQIAY